MERGLTLFVGPFCLCHRCQLGAKDGVCSTREKELQDKLYKKRRVGGIIFYQKCYKQAL